MVLEQFWNTSEVESSSRCLHVLERGEAQRLILAFISGSILLQPSPAILVLLRLTRTTLTALLELGDE